MNDNENLSEVLDEIHARSRGRIRELEPLTDEEKREIEKQRKLRDDDRLASVERLREGTDRGRRYSALRRAIREAQMGLLKHGHRADERTIRELTAALEALGVPSAKASVIADASAEAYRHGDAKAAWTLADEVAGEMVEHGWEPPEPEEELDPRKIAARIPRLGRP